MPNVTLIILGLLGGAGFLLTWMGLTNPRRSVKRATPVAQAVQARLDKARIPADAGAFLTRGALYGALLGGGAWLIIGSPFVAVPAFFGGYLLLWASLIDKRNKEITAYHRDLAIAMDMIVNAWGIAPSMQESIGTVASMGPAESGVRADFEEIYLHLKEGKLALPQILDLVGERRQSAVFDAMATALVVADQSSGEVREMLRRQAAATRAQVDAFENAIARQRSARSEIQVGTFGPWFLYGGARVISLLTGEGFSGVFGGEFFRTPLGILMGMGAVGLSLWAYSAGINAANRGLVVGRVPAEVDDGVISPVAQRVGLRVQRAQTVAELEG